MRKRVGNGLTLAHHSEPTPTATTTTVNSSGQRRGKYQRRLTHVIVIVIVVTALIVVVVMCYVSLQRSKQDSVVVTESFDSSSSFLQSIPPLSALPNPTGHCPTPALDWNAALRKDRFPSVDQRVCYYMTRWFDPHYGTERQWKHRFSHTQIDNTTIEIQWDATKVFTITMEDNQVINDVPFFMFRNDLSLMSTMVKQKISWSLFIFYQKETTAFCNVFPETTSHPILLSWGDQEMKIDVHLPVVSKWRFNDITRHTRPVPILVPLEGGRHYEPLQKVADNDIPWEQKKSVAAWRGDFSGIVHGKFKYDFDYKNKTLETCLLFPRCRLVYFNQNTDHVDVAFSTCSEPEFRTIEGVHMMRPKFSMKEMLQHKMIISIEGNDVASGLKWNLLSKSVVLMPPPEKSIFSMEFLLEQWVHYVPINNVDDFGDAIQWVMDHDEEAKRISQRATNFIHDLFFHPDADADNKAVLNQIANRVTALWEG